MEYSGICGVSTGVFTRGNACWLNDNMICLFIVDDYYVYLYLFCESRFCEINRSVSLRFQHFDEVSANMISWSKVASQTTASSRNYAWIVSPGGCWLTRQTEREIEIKFSLRLSLVANSLSRRRLPVLTWRRFSNAAANTFSTSRITPWSIIAISSIRNAIVSIIYDLYVSIHAFKSNYLVVPYRRELFDGDLCLIKSHVTRGLSGEHKRCRFN
ncbi:hypothetical protein ALC62_13679 [Cyphomyrmex costatus]|uniref:Uncharacterized protein n=1 Tax=Cyphomyrmex costatus TaxID=456900 RepID=A0A151I9D2_9HYME|nr:hypothetical protein ALC62_13679 [Cyphomyrmex costatus]